MTTELGQPPNSCHRDGSVENFVRGIYSMSVHRINSIINEWDKDEKVKQVNKQEQQIGESKQIQLNKSNDDGLKWVEIDKLIWQSRTTTRVYLSICLYQGIGFLSLEFINWPLFTVRSLMQFHTGKFYISWQLLTWRLSWYRNINHSLQT